ncbi:BQ5605_C008g04918 [Microbotryum silenes-dioicae]|uniref:BQ5605_C008g04918 protein n=1 Tax=Microbotryum silenes-dioicae TaxID=796604 RepID=A0A2X0PDU6_9BASI|nr:BQ5605_C008g04918 [Microbotryum silenes-dioicae]
MPKHDPSKAAYTESLATHAPIKSNHLPTPTYRTQAAVSPPHRTVPLNAASGLGRARALYDYEGAEEEDLQISEGEVVTVVEHGESFSGSKMFACTQIHRLAFATVSDEWWKCQAEDGRKGIVPRAYLETL